MNEEQFGAWLKTLRKNNRMTQEELASMLHFTKQTISKWETGKSMTDKVTINRIKEIFCVEAEPVKSTEDPPCFLKMDPGADLAEYSEIAEELLKDINIDNSYFYSVKKAVEDIYWITLYVVFSSEKMADYFCDVSILWQHLGLALQGIVSDSEKGLLESVPSGFAFESSSILKRKLEIIIYIMKHTLEAAESDSPNGTPCSGRYLRDMISLASATGLYDMLPDTDTNWKSSFVYSAQLLSSKMCSLRYSLGHIIESNNISE